ncbi:hypothetical protein OS175_13585 [Marinicella sp. S1101]|uniref:hypothetical protein n=1 Tax=Marinicella marina TaxID=2996016 RepID=UPI002260C301|nr:hypothetical protein [Marinicella marina]MCX7554906.1 hypothetical protein [Marinicella marina]MDJ1141270.1 hypothetical protein [Marinicella marina]
MRKVKTNEFYSLHYSNKAAEHMLKGEYDAAYANIKEALNIKSNNLIAVNILGVLYHRTGHQQWAENSYLYGLSLKGDHLELLNNYHNLLITNGRHSEAEQVATVIASYDNPDPFRWLDLADEELAADNLRKSIRFYEKAIEKADYLHQPYAGIAAANFKLGRIDQALTAMEMAMKNAHTIKTTNRYQVKYNALKSMQETN